MDTSRVLIVDDDLTVSSVVSAYLRRAGIDSRTVSDGSTAERAWQEWKPHLVVLDVMLPGISGLELLRRRRADADHTLVVVLSARGDEDHRIEGFEVGADDYVAKPFSPRELVLRISGLLRRDDRMRSPAGLPPELRAGPLFIDTAARSVRLRGEAVPLTTREYDLLVFLAAHAGQTFGKRELLRRVWGWDYGDNSTVFVHIRRVREKIELDPSDPRMVLTVRGVGYRFATPDEIDVPDVPV
ncbi:response regulator transcription factor [Phytoactinopolyspora alkaliphila]|uniref:Response regulator transcription factor n=1 Tax=Phytoactinopolyspora alkaliphila TaxID=1783498 RepID=A0A6N9YLA6_9ACTN|nr:response regulator transcription factor [Phytoactinopolyspora alkaliphila]NED95816.1 response regulator transcription factor [Phytoactinopolyspora alkaliphila]